MSQGTGDRRRLGTAAWADPDWVAATYPYRDGSVWLGRLPNGAAVGYADDRHVCLVSGSRAGKGTSTIVNNLCAWPGSMVVIDPKGENATVTAARRGAGAAGCEGMGQAVHVLDPFKAASIDDTLRSRFNPFDALDPHNEEAIDEAARLADALVVIHEEGKDPFWDESARALLKGLILHVLTAEEFEGRRNLNTLRQLVTRGDWEAVEVLRESGEDDIPPAQGLLWTGVQRNPAFGGIIAGIGDTFRSMLLNSPKQFESVLQVANRNTEFLDSPAMQRCVETSDFKLSDLKTSAKGLSLYLCLPQRYMNTHYRWLRMMIALVVSEMEIVRGRPATGHPVLVVLDEFAGLKRMEVIEHAVAQIAGYGVKLFFVLQSLEQLKATYKDNWETFLSNAGLKVFFSLDDHFSRDYVSKLIGETEVVRDVRSQSENVSQSETYSESRSESFGTSESRSRSVTGGTNTSVTESDTFGTNRSTSHSQGGSRTTNFREGFLWAHRTRNFSTGQNWSTSQTEGTSETHGVSRTQGSSSGWSDGVTAGTSRTVGTTTGSSHGVSRGQTAGSSETVHRRALIAPDEIGQMFARIDDPDDPCFPGLALAAISGKPPILLRRANYYEDPQFIDRFMPHPDHPHRAAVTIEIGAETFVPFVTHAGSFDLTSWAVSRGDVVMPGQPLAQIGYVNERMTLRSPLSARFIRTWEYEDRPLDVRLCEIVENEGGKFFGVQGYVTQGNLDNTIRRASSLITMRAYDSTAVVDPLVEFRMFARGMDGKIAVLLQRLKTRATWSSVGAAIAALLLIRILVSTGAGVGPVAPVVVMAAVGVYRYFAGKFATLDKARADFRTLALERELAFPPVREPLPETPVREQSTKAALALPAAVDAAVQSVPEQIAQLARTEDPSAPPRAPAQEPLAEQHESPSISAKETTVAVENGVPVGPPAIEPASARLVARDQVTSAVLASASAIPVQESPAGPVTSQQSMALSTSTPQVLSEVIAPSGPVAPVEASAPGNGSRVPHPDSVEAPAAAPAPADAVEIEAAPQSVQELEQKRVLEGPQIEPSAQPPIDEPSDRAKSQDITAAAIGSVPPPGTASGVGALTSPAAIPVAPTAQTKVPSALLTRRYVLGAAAVAAAAVLLAAGVWIGGARRAGAAPDASTPIAPPRASEPSKNPAIVPAVQGQPVPPNVNVIPPTTAPATRIAESTPTTRVETSAPAIRSAFALRYSMQHPIPVVGPSTPTYVESAAFSPDGRRLVSGSAAGTIAVWDVSTGQKLTAFTVEPQVWAIAWSPNGDRLAIVSANNTIAMVDAASGRTIETLVGHRNHIDKLHFSPDGRLLASVGTLENVIKLWDTTMGREVRTLARHEGSADVAFSPDSRLIAGADGKTLKLWNVASGEVVKTLSQADDIFSMAFAPGGRQLATGSLRRKVRLFDLETGREIRAFTGNLGIIYHMAFSPDGTLLAFNSGTYSIQLWDVATGAIRNTFGSPDDPLSAVAFSSDGHWLASAASSGKVRLWAATDR